MVRRRLPWSWQLSEESVGSHAPRVIRFGTIPAIIPVIPEAPIAPADPIVSLEVGAVFVISLTGVLDLVDYSSSFDFDPSEDSLHVAPELPLVSPFLCTNDSEVDSEFEPVEHRPERHESLTPSSEFPLAPVVAPPEIRQRPTILVQPVGPFPARILAWRRVSHCSSGHHSSPYSNSDPSSSSLSSDSSSDISSGSSSDSLSDSSSVHSSGQSHTGPLTRVVSPRLVDPPVRTPRCSEAFMRWKSLDSSSPSAGPSHKRCRSPATLVPSSTPILRSIALALADLSPRKRFRYSYSSEVSGEEHMEMGTADVETVTDLGISDRVRAPTKDGIDLSVEVATSDIREDEEEFEVEASARGTMEIVVDHLATGDISDPTGGDAPDLEGTLYDMSHYMYKVPLDRIMEFKTAQR
ncbi:hypothetical protein Tco_0574435 [Tanacetum coccineum]